MSSSSSSKMIVLRSSDGEVFKVEKTVAMEFQTIKYMIEDNCADTIIPVPNVTGKILSKVIEYSKSHIANSSDNKFLKSFDSEFVKVDNNTLADLMMAADYLDITNLLDLICQTVADMIKGKTPEEIRKTFDISE